MKALHILIVVTLFASAVLFSSCAKTAPDGPVASLGSNTVTKYVAIGDALSAGYQSNALFATAQYTSFPRLISLQIQAAGSTTANFEQPLYGDPGNADPATGKAARYEIISMAGPVIGPRGLTAGTPTNTTLTRPYDNLGIPGAVIFDVLDTTSFAAKANPPRSNAFFQLVLRNKAFGANILSQARNLKPDLITFWFGSNDVLGFATSGGVSPSAPTSAAAFSVLFTQALDSVRAAAPTAKIVVANIPDVRVMPFFTTIGPKVRGSLPAGVKLSYQKHGETGVATGSSDLAEATPPMLCLTGSSYASLLGRPTGQWYRDKKYPALPAGIDTTKPFGLHPQNPWPDALVLDADEQNTAGQAVGAFNATIAARASAVNAALVDMYAFYNVVRVSGYSSGGAKFTADYVAGGFFSLDGVHPASRGSGVIANEFLKVMNAKFGMSIPLVDVSTIPGIPAPVSKAGGPVYPIIPYEAFSSFTMLFGGER